MDVAELPGFRFAGEETRGKAREALRRGVDRVPACRVEAGGVRAGWCRPHDPSTHEPRPGRKHGPAALATAETASVIRLLSSLRARYAGFGTWEDLVPEEYRQGG